MKHEYSSPFSQQYDSGPSSVSGKSTPQSNKLYFKCISNIIFPPKPTFRIFFSLSFTNQNFALISHSNHACYVPLSCSPTLFYPRSHEYIWLKVQIIKPLVNEVPKLPVSFLYVPVLSMLCSFIWESKLETIF